VSAGQGTLALKILEQVPDARCHLVPVGGGDFLAVVSGPCCRAEADLINHSVVEQIPAKAACFAAGLSAAIRCACQSIYLADVLRYRHGQHTLAIAQPLVNRMGNSRSARAGLLHGRKWKNASRIAEPPPAAFWAGNCVPGRAKSVLLLTGGNIDPLAHIRVIERASPADVVFIVLPSCQRPPAVWRISPPCWPTRVLT